MRVAGIDPGQKGAICVVDSLTERIVWIGDMPTVTVTIGGKQRSRTDIPGLDTVFITLAMLSVEMVVLENVGAGFGQNGRVLGENVGLIKMAAHVARIRVEMRTPLAWKRALRCPADKKEACQRAEALFVHDVPKLRGPGGGRSDGRAEAAMLALFGCRHAS
jgi:crossover junction endodeoxyribonuclease RuvC